MTIEETVRRALEEDIGAGDVTSELCVPANCKAKGRIVARESLVIAGLDVLPFLFENLELHVRNGDKLRSGDAIATVCGDARALLSHERVALNFLQRLSGVAT